MLKGGARLSSGGGTSYTEVATYADLPLASANSGAIYVVQTTTGIPLINRKPAGLWRSNGTIWVYLGNGITASDIINTPAGTIAATDAQSAINELDGDIQAHIGSGGAAHANATTSVAGFLEGGDKEKLEAMTVDTGIISIPGGLVVGPVSFGGNFFDAAPSASVFRNEGGFGAVFLDGVLGDDYGFGFLVEEGASLFIVGDGLGGNIIPIIFDPIDSGDTKITPCQTDTRVAFYNKFYSSFYGAATKDGFEFPDNTIQATAAISGAYTPTLTGVSNIAASTAYPCQWSKSGSVIIVSGKVELDPTSPATDTRLGISLPVASALANDYECSGTAFCPTVAGMGASILGDATNDRAELRFVSSDINNNVMSFTFQYQVL